MFITIKDLKGFDFSKNERVQNKLVDSWSECQKYIKGVKGAIYKSFEDVEEAKSFLQKGSELLRKGKDPYGNTGSSGNRDPCLAGKTGDP